MQDKNEVFLFFFSGATSELWSIQDKRGSSSSKTYVCTRSFFSSKKIIPPNWKGPARTLNFVTFSEEVSNKSSK